MVSRAWLPAVVLALVVGCSTKRVEPSRVSAADAAAKALAQYDTNKDGFLDAAELERCPGLKNALKRNDTNKDGRFSREELEEYFGGYVKSQIGSQAVVCRVTLDDKPLAGATVVLEPEAFLGDSVKPAQGVTDAKGEVRPRIEGSDLPGCHLGIYRVRITKTEGGKDSIPPQYNTNTELGLEVGPVMRGQNSFPLRSS
jgi:hypothetical protein